VFSVPVINNTLEEGSLTVALALRNPSALALLSPPSTGWLTLLDDDDFTPPRIAGVTAPDSNTVVVLFNEPMRSATAEIRTNYAVSSVSPVRVAILAADQRTVALGLPGFSSGVHTLRVDHVTDMAGLTIASGTQTNFTYPDPALALWLKLDDGGGTVAADSSLYGCHGSLNNGPAWTAGKRAGALLFDELDDYLLVPDFVYGPDFTVSFWFRCSDNSGMGFQYVFSQGMPQQWNNFNVYIGEDSHGNAADILRTSCADGNDDLTDTTLLSLDVGLTNFPDDVWHLYTATVKAGEGIRVYLDGQFRIANPALGGDAMDPGTGIYVGGRSDLNPDRYFGGLVDDVRLYTRALRADEVAFLYNERPRARITAPAGTDYVQHESMHFAGYGVDEDGSIAQLVWNAATDGDFGTGTSLTWAGLSSGPQIIRLVAYDNRAAGGETSIAIRVWADADTNGLPDYWQAAFWPAGGSGGATNDSDHDGSVNFAEWLAGTDPTNAASVFRILKAVFAPERDGLVITWPCTSNRHYTVTAATNLALPFAAVTNAAWSTAAGTMSFTGAVPPSGAVPLRFYRVEADR